MVAETLFTAIRSHDLAAVQTALGAGISPENVDPNPDAEWRFEPALHVAVRARQQSIEAGGATASAAMDIVRELLRAGASPNTTWQWSEGLPSTGYTALALACLGGDLPTIEALLRAGADPDRRVLAAPDDEFPEFSTPRLVTEENTDIQALFHRLVASPAAVDPLGTWRAYSSDDGDYGPQPFDDEEDTPELTFNADETFFGTAFGEERTGTWTLDAGGLVLHFDTGESITLELDDADQSLVEEISSERRGGRGEMTVRYSKSAP